MAGLINVLGDGPTLSTFCFFFYFLFAFIFFFLAAFVVS